MKLEHWAQIAEVLSGIAVVVTLILLVMELNQGRVAMQINTYHNLVSDLNDLDLTVVTDDAYLLSSAANDGEWTELNLRKRQRFYRAFFRTLESAYFARQGGSLNTVQWERFERNACGAWQRTDARNRTANAFILTEEFVEYLNRQC